MHWGRAGVIGGLIAGVVTTTVMIGGRRSGLLGKTLDRDAVDWIDERTGSRDVIGDAGTSVVEFANHLAASAVFGFGYTLLRQAVPRASPWQLGAGYGAALYVVNIAGVAPVLGITEGERRAGVRKAAERLVLHILQSVCTGLVAERLAGAGDHRGREPAGRDSGASDREA